MNVIEGLALFITLQLHLSCQIQLIINCSCDLFQIIDKERLQENSKTIGTYMLLELAKLKTKYPVFGDVRGKGLMIGVELVEDSSRKPLSPEKILRFWEHCRDLGLIVGKGGAAGNVSSLR